MGAWFAQLVLSKHIGKLVGMDTSAALGMPGVKDFVGASAIPQGGVNYWSGDFGAFTKTTDDKVSVAITLALSSHTRFSRTASIPLHLRPAVSHPALS